MKHSPISGLVLAILVSAGPTLPAIADAGHSGPASIGQPSDAVHATRTIHVDMTDNEFSIEKLHVKPGETIRFILVNSGDYLHEFNIGTKDMHAGHQEEMMTMMDKGMITHDKMVMPMAHNDANSVLVEPGQSKELVWTFPKTARLEFACNVPGHYQSGMVGTIQIRS